MLSTNDSIMSGTRFETRNPLGQGTAQRRMFPGQFFLTLFLGLVLVVSASADQLDQWNWRNPQPFNPQISSVVHGNGLWLVLATTTGLLATSPNGISWDLAGLGTNAGAYASAFGTNRFVVATPKGVFISTDGHAWSKAATALNNLNDVAFGNGLFLGVNSGNTVSHSTDGSTWPGQSVWSGSTAFTRVSFANGRFFIMGSGSSGQLLYSSTDASTWTGPVSLNTNGIQKIVYGNGVYVSLNEVITANATWSEFRTSTDGATWSAPNQFTNHLFTDAVFASGRFVVLNEVGAVLFSPDGTNWTEQLAPELFGGVKMAWDGSLYLVSGVFGRIVTSTDGTNWVRRTIGPQNSLVGITHSGGLYVAVGGNLVPGGGDPYSSSTVATSVNGQNWAEHNPGTTNSLLAVVGWNGRYVAVGTNGTIVTSVDATNWSAAVSPTTNLLYGVAYGNGTFVAVGGATNFDAIITSADGLTWTGSGEPSNYNPLYAITYAQGQFVAVGQTNTSKLATTLTSPDGLTWTARTSAATNNLRAITFGNGVYVAVGDHGALVTSADAVTWTNQAFNPLISWRAVAYGNGWYVAMAYPSVLGVSSNAVNWSLRSPFSAISLQPLYNLIYGDTSFFLTGLAGEVLESGSFNPPADEISLVLSETDRPFLSFTGPEGRGYEIDGADTLPPVWQSLATFTNVSATTTLPVSPATNSNARFYRMKLLN
jgi:hypothetical protein